MHRYTIDYHASLFEWCVQQYKFLCFKNVCKISKKEKQNVTGNLRVEGADSSQAVFTSNYPVTQAVSQWAGLLQKPGGK